MTAFLFLTAGVCGCALLRPPAAPPADPFEEARGQIRLKGDSDLVAGVAKVEITPAVGTPLAGYSKRRGKPSVGTRDPLFVRALALGDGEDLVVLVSADLLVFPHPLAQSILQEIAKENSLPPEAIVLAATHTHSGSGSIATGLLHEMVFGPYRKEVAEGVASRLRWAVRQAIEHRQPARWAVGSQKEILEGFIENRRDPAGWIDPSMEVLFIGSVQGKPLAIVVHAAAHPTLMDSKDFRFSADFPGEMALALETAYPGAVSLFFNGAAADLRPRDGIGPNPEERIRRFGNLLAEVATGLINQMKLQGRADLAAWRWSVPLPAPELHLGPVPIHPGIGRLFRPSTAQLNLVAWDQLLLIPLPSEPTAQLGKELKEALAGQGLHPILIGYANGYLGYAVTPQQYRTRSYEASMTWYGPTFGQVINDRVRQLADLYRQKKGIKPSQ